MYKEQYKWLQLSLMMVDCALSIGAFILAGLLRFGQFSVFLGSTSIFQLFTITFLSSVAAFEFAGMYKEFFTRGYLRELFADLLYTILMALIIAFYSFGTKNTMLLSRLTLYYFIIINLLLVYTAHLLIKKTGIVHAKSKNGWKLLIITDSENVAETCKSIQNSDWKGRAIGLILMDRGQPEANDAENIPLVVTTDYVEYVTKNPVDEVLLSVSDEHYQTETIKKLLIEIGKTGAVVSIKMRFADIDDFHVSKITRLDKFFVASFANREYDYILIIFKRIMDITGALIGLLFTLIVAVFVAPAILIESPGPLLFKQKRVGRNGRIFTMYKFRSMYADAEAQKEKLLEKNKMKGLLFKVKDDPRITRVGKFIRRTSIDELPQFYNILIGDMSLVGTRPPTLDEYKAYSSYNKKRLSFRPGLTGIWQVSGRNEITDFDDVMKMDLQYIRDWSLYLDIKLILRTIISVLLRKGAE